MSLSQGRCKILKACEKLNTRIIAYRSTFLRPNVCEKFTSFCQVLKKLHKKENWFFFSASRCISHIEERKLFSIRRRRLRSLQCGWQDRLFNLHSKLAVVLNILLAALLADFRSSWYRHTHTRTHTWPIALPMPVKWPVVKRGDDKSLISAEERARKSWHVYRRDCRTCWCLPARQSTRIDALIIVTT